MRDRVIENTVGVSFCGYREKNGYIKRNIKINVGNNLIDKCNIDCSGRVRIFIDDNNPCILYIKPTTKSLGFIVRSGVDYNLKRHNYSHIEFKYDNYFRPTDSYSMFEAAYKIHPEGGIFVFLKEKPKGYHYDITKFSENVPKRVIFKNYITRNSVRIGKSIINKNINKIRLKFYIGIHVLEEANLSTYKRVKIQKTGNCFHITGTTGNGKGTYSVYKKKMLKNKSYAEVSVLLVELVDDFLKLNSDAPIMVYHHEVINNRINVFFDKQVDISDMQEYVDEKKINRCPHCNELLEEIKGLLNNG